MCYDGQQGHGGEQEYGYQQGYEQGYEVQQDIGGQRVGGHDCGGQDCGGQDNDVVRTRAPPASGFGTSCSDQSGEVGHPSDLTPWSPSFPRHTPKPGQPPYVFHSSDPPLVCHADELRVRLHEMAVGTDRVTVTQSPERLARDSTVGDTQRFS